VRKVHARAGPIFKFSFYLVLSGLGYIIFLAALIDSDDEFRLQQRLGQRRPWQSAPSAEDALSPHVALIFLLVSFRACGVSSRADVGGNIDVVCLEPPIEPTNVGSTRQQSKVGSTQPLYGRVAGIFFLPRSQLGRCLRQIKQKGGDVRGIKSNREHKSLKTRGSTASCRKERRL
jgi:hypothetical protein